MVQKLPWPESSHILTSQAMNPVVIGSKTYSVVAESNKFILYERINENVSAWRNFVLDAKMPAPKRRYRLSWNGCRVSHSQDYSDLRKYLPDAAQWVLSYLLQDRSVPEDSREQALCVEYLLDRLQFPPSAFREEYLKHLSAHSEDFVVLSSKPIERDAETGRLIYPRDHAFRRYIIQNKRFVPTHITLPDLLMSELHFRSRQEHFLLTTSTNTISATDIAHFTYCPVGWSIAKSYRLPTPLSAQTGTSMHAQHLLINFVPSLQSDGSRIGPARDLTRYISTIGCNSEALLRDLGDSVAVFVGTTKNGGSAGGFTGRDKRYIGAPDYIFFNQKYKRYFVVEEKFQLIPRAPRSYLTAEWCASHGYDPDKIKQQRQRITFYDNHLNQLRSYVYGITEFGPLYGYLVYWKYSLSDKYHADFDGSLEPRIEFLNARCVSGADATDLNELSSVYTQIKHAMRDGGGEFDRASRSPLRCARCVHHLLCGHMTGRFDRYSFPYQPEYLKLAP